MIFRTSIHLTPHNYLFSHKDAFYCIGSCFADNISQKLSEYKFDVDANPLGVVYNPMSICSSMQRILNLEHFNDTDLNKDVNSNKFFSFDTHTLLNGEDKNLTLNKLNQILTDTNKNLIKSKVVIITLGTSFVYRLKSNGKVVSNCQKQPSSTFTRERVKTCEVVKALSDLFSNEIFSKKQIILTVSPIRHIKDGFEANSLSKSTLLCSVNEICEKFNNVSYFPSYEIMMDDLRDYRFYAEDMIHPSKIAIDYIWEQFKTRYISEQAKQQFSEIELIQKRLNHRPFNPESESHIKFLNDLHKRIETLNKKMGKTVF